MVLQKKYNVNVYRLSEEEKKKRNGNKLFGVIIFTGVGLLAYSKFKKINK